MIRGYLDVHRERFPLNEPKLELLERHMWETDSPYARRATTGGGIELLAQGRSAVSLVVWLESYLSEPVASASGAPRS